MSGFIMMMRNDAFQTMFRKGYHAEYVVISEIAFRAKRAYCPVEKLEAGQAKMGDFESLNLTRQKYRTALKNLEKWGFITINPTKRGTIATLVNSALFDINISEPNQQDNQKLTNSQPSPNQQLTTNNKEIINNIKNKPNTSAAKVVNFDSLELPGWVNRELFVEFLNERKRLKASNSETAIKRLLNKLSELSGNNPVVAAKIIDESITNSWKGLFPLKQEVKPQPVYTPPRLKEF